MNGFAIGEHNCFSGVKVMNRSQPREAGGSCFQAASQGGAGARNFARLKGWEPAIH